MAYSLMVISEPRDKEKIKPNHIYLAPANYHLYIEPDNTFALSTEEPVNHSRPSIDISFVSAAYVLKKKLTGIILSGANKDGAQGLKQIAEQKGNVLIQSIKEAQVQTMPQYAKDLVPMAKEYTISEIIEYILNC
ncbi:MAG: chemotaxis protein CheB [Bacteroidota bacterium]|nr:chemotaxis protein CheB [Bacteroidota bacterium]